MGSQVLQERMNKLATKLVKKFAGPEGTASLIVRTPGAYDPLTCSEDAATEATTILDVSPPVPVTQRHVQEISAVLEGDMMVWIAASEFTFERDMIGNLDLEYVGDKYRMIWYKEYYAGEEVSAYKVFVRNV
jgi:hypothetical protein